MKTTLLILFILFGSILVFSQTSKVEVSYIVDGDTIRLKDKQYIRLIGINSPEKDQPCGLEAKEHLLSLLKDKEITLEADSTQADKDRYGRLLRYVFVNGKNINLQMIKDGFAYEYTYSKPYKYQKEFKEADKGVRCN